MNNNQLPWRERIRLFLKRYRLLFILAKAVQLSFIEFRKLLWLIKRPHLIKNYLQVYQTKKLHIGVGPAYSFLPGWLNVDYYPTLSHIVFLDATRPFPFPDNTFDYIFSEHMIEHITYHEGLFMLRECYRVLKPNGKIRITTLDLEMIVGLYKQPKNELQRKYIKWIIDNFVTEINIYKESFVINNMFNNYGHQFIYDHATLQNAMEQVEFTNIRRYLPNESDDEHFQAIETHDKSPIGTEEMNRFESMVLEGRKISS